MERYKVLSIDAWADGEEGWTWNQWFNAGTVELESLDDDSKVLKAMEDHGFIKNAELGEVDDDQYNLVICDKANHMPVFAIVYGDRF